MQININFAESKKDFLFTKILFIEYARSLNFSLSFQNFEKELDTLPGKYTMPEGCIILARDNLDPIGCIGMRPLDNRTCEIKRLYLKPDYRGNGLGKILAKKILEYCLEMEYIKVYLDTTSRMESALSIYKSLGFIETSPYYENPLPDVIFFELNLLNKNLN
tara:strand:- start:507 stop:992 length:486 start_codon:yes stop_codon:yes gene_type:complete